MQVSDTGLINGPLAPEVKGRAAYCLIFLFLHCNAASMVMLMHALTEAEEAHLILVLSDRLEALVHQAGSSGQPLLHCLARLPIKQGS